MKKSVSFILALIFVLSAALIFTACGTNGEIAETTAPKAKIYLKAVKDGEVVAEGNITYENEDEIPDIFECAEDIFHRYDIMYSQRGGRYEYIADIGESSMKTEEGSVKFTWECSVGDTEYSPDELHNVKPSAGDTVVFTYTGRNIEGSY